jgi:hypothetical protein
MSYVGKRPAKPVDAPRRDDVELPASGVLPEAVEAGPSIASLGARYALVAVRLDNLPAARRSDSRKLPLLVLDGLSRGADPQVESDAHGISDPLDACQVGMKPRESGRFRASFSRDFLYGCYHPAATACSARQTARPVCWAFPHGRQRRLFRGPASLWFLPKGLAQPCEEPIREPSPIPVAFHPRLWQVWADINSARPGRDLS